MRGRLDARGGRGFGLHPGASLRLAAGLCAWTLVGVIETLGMMGAAQFAAMPEGSIYLNAARAGLQEAKIELYQVHVIVNPDQRSATAQLVATTCINGSDEALRRSRTWRGEW